jgi:hypothetical protein
MGLVNLILAAICFASLTFMALVYMHHSAANSDHTNHKDAKSISHPLQEQYNVLSESVAEKREELRNSYLLALQQQKQKEKGGQSTPERDGLDAKVTAESPRNFLKPSAITTSAQGDRDVQGGVTKTRSESSGFVLPGAGDHRILTLSDRSFESTPVSEMMSW